MFDQAVIDLQHEHKAAHQNEHGEEGQLMLPQPAHGADLEAGAQAGGRRWSQGWSGCDRGGAGARRHQNCSLGLGETRQRDAKQKEADQTGRLANSIKKIQNHVAGK